MSLARRIVCSLVVVASSAACTAASTDEVLDPSAVVIDKSTHALSAASIEWIDGTYSASCKNPETGAARTAGEGWSLRISGAATMTHPALKVTKGDSDCTLSLSGLRTTSALYDAAPAFAMATSYQSSGSAFSTGAGAIEFYGNAKLSATDMASNFTITVLVSDDLATASGGTKTGSYAQFAGSGDMGEVAAPEYSMTNTIALEANVDDTVSATTGSFTLSLGEGAQAGDTYRIVDAELASPTFASVDAAYNAGGGHEPVTISGSPVTIASADLLANGTALPAKRTVIVRRVQDGVAAYQIFSLEFAAPPAG